MKTDWTKRAGAEGEALLATFDKSSKGAPATPVKK
jgi:hypothetical protein